MQNNKLKVGFDLDGVLLYNPARIFRPITIAFKSVLPKKKKNGSVHFYYPKSSLEQLIWKIVHWSSMFPASGITDIEQLAKEGKIEPYIITSRYDSLKDDFENWLNKMNAHVIFKETFHNKLNKQPHHFKVEMINKLGLDYFVEDNWDIVQHINKNTKTKGIWITNLFDKHIPYDLKYMSLQEAINFLKKEVNT
ncbi:MAG TPA: hypothetical protein PLS49_01345 [Candidatus Woesebacteria bacterium]|nr:hypothetical protein [Candidatus Woesebacteria bacterium]